MWRFSTAVWDITIHVGITLQQGTQPCMWRNNTVVGDIHVQLFMWRIKGGHHSVFGHISVQKEKYYIIRIKKWLFGNRLLHLYTESYLPLAGKQIYLNLYTDICLPLVDEYILKPCSGSKFSYCSKNRTLCQAVV